MIDDFINSLKIQTYSFSKKNLPEYALNKYMKSSWPIVYIIKNDKISEAYIGESTNGYNRMKNHLSNNKKKTLNELLVISCNKFNKSAVLDIESKLISYMDADNNYKLQNGNAGIVDHNYYQKKEYEKIFRKIWKMLLQKKYAENEIERLDNSDYFKYSPYKSLSNDQHDSIIKILRVLNKNKKGKIFVEGGPGTGKTILAIYLMKLIKTHIQDFHLDESDEVYSEEIKSVLKFKKKYPNPKVAFVVPMTSLRQTLKKVFRSVKGLKANMVIGPSEVVKNYYDLLIIDEAHRLKKRKNITNYGSFDAINNKLGLEIEKGTELDWIIIKSTHQIFFYDQNQSIKPSDVDENRFLIEKKNSKKIKLISQHRVTGGVDYINFIDSLLKGTLTKTFNEINNSDYELKLFENINEMHGLLQKKEKIHGLCRMLAGISWEWKSKKNTNSNDIIIDGKNFTWNTTHLDWINSKNAINEIGCIHTSQGYDLNYAAVIFGNEITFNRKKNSIEINANKYYDVKGKAGLKNTNLLKDYILNIYKTMLTRGIKGTFIYVCNDELRDYFKTKLETV